MKKLLVLAIVLQLAACSSKTEPVIENGYALQTRELTLNGLVDLHHGRLASAEASLQRALRSAWLSTDLSWIARAQYHVGALYLAQARYEQAASMLTVAGDNAEKAGDQVTVWRSTFARALLHQQRGLDSVALPELHKTMPADVYLSAARLAHLQQRFSAAKQSYNHIVSQPLTTADAYYHQALANMGLALVARDEQQQALAVNYAGKVLELSRQAGFPQLAAHALLLQGTLLEDEVRVERALHIYEGLSDAKGRYESLQLLVRLAQTGEDKQRVQVWQSALRKLDYQETGR